MKSISKAVFILLLAVILTSCKKEKGEETALRVSEVAEVTNEPETTEDTGDIAQPEETILKETEPSEVEDSKVDADNHTKQIGLNSYVNVEDVADSADSVIHSKHENILFRQDFEVSVPKELGEYLLKQSSSFNKDGESVPKYFVGNKFKKKYLSLDKDQDMKSYTYDDRANKLYVGTEENGFCYYENGDNCWSDDNIAKEWVFVRGEYNKDTAYEVKGGKMTIPQALKSGQEFMNQYAKKYGDLSWTPLVVAIRQEKDETYGFEIYYTPAFKDVNFCYISDNIFSDLSGLERIGFSDSCMISNNVYINSVDEIGGFRDTVGMVTYNKTEKVYDQIISFEQAVKIVENNIKSGTCHNVINAQIEYLIDVEEHDESKDTNSINNSGDVYRTRPYWVFYMGESQSEVPETSIVVDCLTGECKQTYENGSIINTIVEQY